MGLLILMMLSQSFPTSFTARQGRALDGGTTAWVVECTNCSGGGSSSGGGTIDGGTVTATQGLSNDGGYSWHVQIDSTINVADAGVLNVNFPASQAISAASLPLPTGASTAAKQPALGTAGSASSDVISVQGIASMTALKVDGSGVTQPVSGTVTANAGTNLNTSALALDATLTGGTQKAIARGGAKGATAAADVTSTANGADHQGLDVQLQNASVAVTGTFFQATQPVSGTVTTTPPSNASTNVTQFGGTNISTGTGASGTGIPRVTVSNDSNVLATQSGTWSVNNTQQGTASQNVAQFGGNAVVTGTGAAGSGVPRVTVSNDSNVLATQSGAWTVTANAGTNLNTSALALDSTVGRAQGSTTSGLTGPLVQAAVSAAAPQYADGTTNPLSMTGIGALRVHEIGPSPTQVTGNVGLTAALGGAAFAGPLVNRNALGLVTRNIPTGTQQVGGTVAIGSSAATVGVDSTLQSLRVSNRPFEALGVYGVAGTTGQYTGLGANTPLFSMRWGTSTGNIAVILKVQVMVITVTAASAAGITERQLIVARNFTASDTGGTNVTISGNDQKRRTSMGTSLFTNVQFGAPLTAGTRTLDTNPVSTTIGWSAVNHTGMIIGGSGGGATAAAWATNGGTWVSLLDALSMGDYPIVLAQNEGIVVRIGVAMPTSAVQQTFVNVVWAEVQSF